MKNRTLTLLILLHLAVSPKLFSQNVAINSTGSAPDASAMLDVSSTTKGFLLPRMTTTEQDAIVLPATGLSIFNTTLNSIMLNTGTPLSPVWSPLSAGAIDTSSIANFYAKVRSELAGGAGITYNNVSGVISNSGVRSLNGNTGSLTMDTGYISNFHTKVRSLFSSASPITITNGLIGITQATTSSDGYLSSTDWNTFNNKADPTNVWSTLGNNVASVQKIGTTSNFDFPFITNNTEKMRLTATGNLGIGTSTFNATYPEKLVVDAGSTSSVNAIVGKGSINSYLQLNIQNSNAGTNASSDVVATADNGNETSNYVDMGINSSVNTSAVMGGANDSYLYNIGQNFLIGTGTAGKSLVFMTGGTAQSAYERMRIDGSGNVGIGTTSPSTKLHVYGTNPLTLIGVQTGTATSADSLLTITSGLVRKLPVSTFASAFTSGNLTETGSGILTITGGTNAIIGTGTTIQVKQATGLQNGFLSSTDWNTFNNKQPAGSYLTGNQTITLSGDISGSGTTSIAATLPTVNSNVGTFNNITINAKGLATAGSNVAYLTSIDTTNISNFSTKVRSLFSATAPITLSNGAIGITQATTSTNGYLSSTDWNTFNSKQAAGSYLTSNQSITFAPTGDVTGTASGTTNIAPVLSIGTNKVLNSMLAQMPALTIKGNNTGGTANAADLTVAQVNAILPTFTATLNGLAPLSSGGTSNFLRADGTWAALPAALGSWSLTGNAAISAITNFIGTTDNKSLRFRTNNVQRMILDSVGNVGIGSSAFDGSQPEKLLVDAGTSASNNLIGAYGDINNYVQIGVMNRNSGNSASSDIVATADNGTNTTNYIDMGINSSGYANNNSNILNRSNVGYIYTNATADFFIGNGAPNQELIFFTNNGVAGNTTANGNEVMRIDGNGNVGIGGTSRSNVGVATTNAEKLVVSGNVIPRTNGGGNLGSTTYRWGTVYAQNALNTSSDRRLKTNIANLNYGLKEVIAMQPVSYNWKTTPDTDKKLGLIAQDVRRIVPEVVKGDEAKETLSIAYSDLIPVLINAIKEQQQQIESLKKDVQLLKDKK